MTFTAATYLQAVDSSAIYDANNHGLATNFPAASGLHVRGVLRRMLVNKRNRSKILETSTATATPAAAAKHIKCVSYPLVLASITLPTQFSILPVATAIATLGPSQTHLEIQVMRATFLQLSRRH